jgi:hypothetical protein
MPRRKNQKSEVVNAEPQPPGDALELYPADEEPPPPKAERQAEWERVLGLRAGDLDRERVERRDRAHQAYVRTQIDACYGVENKK